MPLCTNGMDCVVVEEENKRRFGPMGPHPDVLTLEGRHILLINCYTYIWLARKGYQRSEREETRDSVFS